MKTKTKKEKKISGAISKRIRVSKETATSSPSQRTYNIVVAPTDVTIKLRVKANQLFSLPGYNQIDINNLCELSDGTEISPFGANKEYFVSEVSLDKDVTWFAEPANINGEDEGFDVVVTAYDYKQNRANNTNFFTPDRIPEAGGKVEGHAKNDPDLEFKEDIYAIEFRIIDRKTKKYSDYVIDPKLKINPKYLYVLPHDDNSRSNELDEEFDQAVENI